MTTRPGYGEQVAQFTLLLYLPLLLFLSLSPPSAACELLAYLDRSHTCGRSVVQINHVEDCRLSFGNMWAITDLYVLAHLLGWAVKALIIPHPLLLCSSSVIFEVVEMILIPFIPSLAECWWDSLLMDIFGCNALGIFVGLTFSTRPLTQTNANVLTIFHYLIIILSMTLTDVNTFLLKHTFSISSASPLLLVRILFYASLAFLTLSPYRNPICQPVLHSRLAALYILSLSTEIFAAYLAWPKYR